MSLSTTPLHLPNFIEQVAQSETWQKIACIPIVGIIPATLVERVLANKIHQTPAGTDWFHQSARLKLEMKWHNASGLRNLLNTALVGCAIALKIISPLSGCGISMLFIRMMVQHLEFESRAQRDLSEITWAFNHLSQELRAVTGMLGQIEDLQGQAARQNV